MLLFLILLFTLAILVTFIVLSVSAAGAISVLVFGDVIVCIFIIVWLLKLIYKKKH